MCLAWQFLWFIEFLYKSLLRHFVVLNFKRELEAVLFEFVVSQFDHCYLLNFNSQKFPFHLETETKLKITKFCIFSAFLLWFCVNTSWSFRFWIHKQNRVCTSMKFRLFWNSVFSYDKKKTGNFQLLNKAQLKNNLNVMQLSNFFW